MKYYYFVTISLMILSQWSCSDHVESLQHDTTIEIIKPNINQHFRVGDTIKVVALIQSNVSMHGYEVVLRKDGQTISLKSKHAHNKAFEVFVEWIVPITEPSEVLIEVIANIDHETTKQTKNIAVKII